MNLIRTEQQLLHAIQQYPMIVAEALQRINRFNGQHPTSNVLVHSLDVYDRVLAARPDARKQLLAWCCLHDAHELLSGDIARAWKAPSQVDWQERIDHYLMHHLGLDLDQDEREFVEHHDTASGDDELRLGGLMPYVSRVSPVYTWHEILQEVLP